MKAGRIVRARLADNGRLIGEGHVLQTRADKSRLSDPAAFVSDQDAPVLTARQLSSFRRVHRQKTLDPSRVRKRLKMSQAAFAHVFGVSVRTVQEWEQRRRHPAGAARTLLQVIDREPEAVRRAIGM